MESICCHGKLEDSNTKLELAMQTQRKRTWLPDCARAGSYEGACSWSTHSSLQSLAPFLLHVFTFSLPCTERVHRQHPLSDLSTGPAASGENMHLSRVTPSAEGQGVLYSHLNSITKTHLFHIPQEQQLQITRTFTDSAPSSPEKFYWPQGLLVWGLVSLFFFCWGCFC